MTMSDKRYDEYLKQEAARQRKIEESVNGLVQCNDPISVLGFHAYHVQPTTDLIATLGTFWSHNPYMRRYVTEVYWNMRKTHDAWPPLPKSAIGKPTLAVSLKVQGHWVKADARAYMRPNNTVKISFEVAGHRKTKMVKADNVQACFDVLTAAGLRFSSDELMAAQAESESISSAKHERKEEKAA
jgi:hypothetical protein